MATNKTVFFMIGVLLIVLGFSMLIPYSMQLIYSENSHSFVSSSFVTIFIGVLFVTITAAIICFPTISLWALFGSALRKFVTNLRVKKTIEYLLAILLVLTGLFILLK